MEGLPERYDAEALTSALRALEARIARPGHAADAATRRDFPDPAEAGRLGIGAPAGTYGGDPDPRVVAAVERSAGPVVGGWQRFRIEAGIVLPVLWLGPIVRQSPTGAAPNSNPWDVMPIVFGAFVTDIPHGLGRIPTRWQPLAPNDEDGPIGQQVTVAGGTKWAAGTKFRLDVDFVPILARTATDVEHTLKHLIGFAGTGGNSDFGWTSQDLTGNVFESPDLQRAMAARLVARADRVSGLVVATSWGLNALSFTQAQASGAFNLVMRYGGGPLGQRGFATAKDEDVRWTAPLPVLGKSIGAVYGDKDAPNTLATLFSDGTRAMLTAGAVEWALR